MAIREIGLDDTYSQAKRPKHCGKPMDPSPGDGIWECQKCPRWAHFPQGLPPQVQGQDLEKHTVVYDQLMS